MISKSQEASTLPMPVCLMYEDDVREEREYIPSMVTARSHQLVPSVIDPIHWQINNQKFMNDGFQEYVYSGSAWLPCFFHPETNELILL